ncbi:MAG: T9SS type B sorting domain-containing protein, partial [Saprospiraceae bacterium]
NWLFTIWSVSNSICSCRRSYLCILLIISLLCFAHFLNAQSVPCDGAYYLFLTPHSNARTSAMYRVTTDPVSKVPQFQLINADLGHRVTAAGYSVWQERIYALDYHTKQVLRIDGNGQVEAFQVPLYLDTANVFTAGEVSPGGGNLLVIGWDKNAKRDQTLFSIRLYQDNFLAGRVSILSDFAATHEDVAFDPVRGTFYGYNLQGNKLTWINSFSGQVTDYFSRNMEGVTTLGSLFFDRAGQLHAYGSSGGSEERTFFDIDKLQGRAQAIAEGPLGRFSDGCTCPYTVRNLKTVQPQQILPCTEITVTYNIINHAGTAYSYISVKDTFPEGFVITKIVKAPQTAIIKSGVGSNILALEGIDMILDTNRVIITLEATENILPGKYASQAVLGELPTAFGKKILSDDPTTSAHLDASVIEIIGEQNRGQLIRQRFTCDGQGVILETDVPNATYLWSTGDASASTLATQPGWYAVTINADCGNFIDSIYLDSIPAPLNVILPPLITIELGTSLNNITPIINSNRPITYQWQATDGSTVDCPDCPTLSAQPAQNTIYTLTITDASGCQSTDSMRVEVLPVRQIYAPTAFSPNGDGVNDIFYLQGKYAAKIIYFRIFDRWGNQIFQVQNGVLNDPDFGWNGQVAGQQINAQAYLYMAEIEFADGIKQRLSGEVSLIK